MVLPQHKRMMLLLVVLIVKVLALMRPLLGRMGSLVCEPNLLRGLVLSSTWMPELCWAALVVVLEGVGVLLKLTPKLLAMSHSWMPRWASTP